jgi:hypothetical protein
MRIPVRLLIVVVLVCGALPAISASFIVPSDREMIDASKAIVIATTVGSHAVRTHEGHIDTVVDLAIEEVIKGSFRADFPLQLVEGGGSLGGRYEIVPEAPKYRAGERALIFIDMNKRGEYSTYGMILGKFNFVRDLHGQRLLLRGADDGEIFGWDVAGTRHTETIRTEEGFLGFVRAAACGLSASDAYFASDVHFSPSHRVKSTANSQGFHAADYQDLAIGPGCSGCGIRWQDIFDFPGGHGSVTFQVIGTQAGIADPLGGIDRAMGAWNSDANSNVNYLRGSSGLGVIHLDDSADVPSPAVGFTRYGGGDTYTFDGASMIATSDVDIAIKANFTTSQTVFEEVMTHELGHSLSFRHSGDRAPATSQAVMNFQVSGFGSSLQPWDIDAVETVYNPNPSGTCTPPSISVQPAASTTITAGQSTTLSVGAAGTGLTYQWYIGTSGTTTTPAPNGTTNQLTVSPSVRTSYWVRVTGQCPSPADSRTATVTVNQPTCTPPTVPAPSAVPSSISSGQSSTLTANAAGTGPFTYQWYVGASGNTASPISGQTNSSVTVSPVTTTSYWVRVTGQCAPPADSAATTVTVNQPACVPPSAPTPNASPSSISSGQTSTLSVSPAGTAPFTYQWFVGASGDPSAPITGATSFSTTVSPTATTSYWVKVTGQCAPPANSPTATVTVICTPIAAGGVGAQPPTINVGQSSTISVTTSGSGPFTFQWFRGSLGDASNPIAGATGFNTLVSPATSTSYWVHVTAPCGSQDGAVTVFVNAPCTQSSITTNPGFPTVAPGASTTLTVAAAGTAPISYQWYTGTSGNTGSPIAGATGASVTVSPAVTTSYWVRVSNSCNQTGNNSTTAVVTVSASCPAPAITTQPSSASAGLGTAATLSVVAAAPGTTIHYQWYKGAKGDLSTKVGTDSPTFTTGAVSITTSYWVRLTAACNNLSFTDSNAAIVTAVAAPRGRAVKH